VVSGNVANAGAAMASLLTTTDAGGFGGHVDNAGARTTTKGKGLPQFSSGFGGGIYNAGALILSDTTLEGNTANTGSSSFSSGGFGGAIDNNGELTVRNGIFTGNVANSAN